MREFLTIILALSVLSLSTVVMADEKVSDTIVGADQLLKNSYHYVDPQKKSDVSPETKKLIEQGSITVVKDAQVKGQTSAPKK